MRSPLHESGGEKRIPMTRGCRCVHADIQQSVCGTKSRRECCCGCRSAAWQALAGLLSQYEWHLDLPCGSSARSCRSEEHTSELQSRENLVCRLLLEK